MFIVKIVDFSGILEYDCSSVQERNEKITWNSVRNIFVLKSGKIFDS